MKNARGLALVVLFLALAGLACGGLTTTAATSPAATNAAPTAASNADPSVEPDVEPTTTPEVEPSAAPATIAPTARPTASPEPTEAPLKLEIVQTQTWTDVQGNARTNVLLRNPYDFPVALRSGARAVLRNAAGDLMREGNLYFLDGISAGTGFLLPGETVAANACFTCEEQLMTEDWAAVEYFTVIQAATGQWEVSTEVEPTVANVSFGGDSLFFDISGTVTNNSDGALQRISVRVVVYDEAGQLVGAAEASAWDVAAGATAAFDGYGLGQAPAGPIHYEVSAAGVNY